MNIDLVDRLACPRDGGYPLRLREPPGSERITSGVLVCPSCGCDYKILDGIVSFLAGEQGALSQLQALEQDARDREYRDGEVYESAVSRLPELDAVAGALGDCTGLHVLDAGCGTGELTQVLQGAARVVGLDFSIAGLRAHRLRDLPKVDLVHADASRLPFHDNVFDAAICTQVMQHLPSAAHRAALIAHLGRVLKPGGKLILLTYNWNSYHRRAGTPKDDSYDNGVFVRRCEMEELRSDLSSSFEVEAIVPVQIALPMTYRLVGALGAKNVIWDRYWRKRAFSVGYAKFLLAQCRARK